MSVCTFIAANCPMDEVRPSKEYPLEINIDEGTIYDGDADDNFSLCKFREVSDYTDKKYGVSLEWAYYTESRAKLILKYISDALSRTDTVEVWHVWLPYDYYEYDERPIIKKKTLHIDEISPEDIREIDNAVIWEKPNSIRPIFYCLEIIK
jgi:hypothetical protein